MASVEVIDLTADSPISDRAFDAPPVVPQGQPNHRELFRFDSPASGSSPIVMERQLSSPPIAAFRASRPPVAGPSRTRRRTRSPSPDSDIEIVGESEPADELTRMRNRLERNQRMVRAGILVVPRAVRRHNADDRDDASDVAVNGDGPVVEDAPRLARIGPRGDGPPPRQRRRVEVEDVIDVDELVEVEYGRAHVQSPPPPQHRRRQVSRRAPEGRQRGSLQPGEGGAEAGPSRPRGHQRNHPPRRALFSPDPPPLDNYVPPVPPLPPLFQFVHPPVPPPPQPQPPPPPRRNPVMNLGGAIMARGLFNNFFGFGGPAGVAAGLGILPPPQAPFGSLAGIGWGFGGLDLPPIMQVPPGWGRDAPAPQPPRPADESTKNYQPTMTHPHKAWPGFASNFAPASNPSAASTSTKKPPALVCANCHRPLIINAEGDRKIWALRCGHMLDAKCVEQLSKPPVKTLTMLLDEDAERMAAAAAAGQGSSKGAEAVTSKGKGKQCAVSAATLDIELTGTPDGGIRSRLRSSRHPAAPTSPVHTHAADPSGSAAPAPTMPQGRRRGGKGRGKNHHQELPQEEFEWYCPVARCGRLHVSVKVRPEMAVVGKGKGKARATAIKQAEVPPGQENGVWKAGGAGGHKEKGAVPVFV